MQYLVGLAVVEAVKTIPGLEQLGICLKWPNDIYADFGETDGSGDRYRKIGGVLINSSYANGVFSLVAGAFRGRRGLFCAAADLRFSRLRRERQQPEANDLNQRDDPAHE